MKFYEVLAADFAERYQEQPSGWFQILRSAFNCREFMAVVLVRIQSRLYEGWSWVPFLRTFVYNLMCAVYGVDIHPKVRIGPGFVIHHCQAIIIGPGVRIGAKFHIYHGVTLGARNSEALDCWPTIGDDVIVYTGSVIAGRLTIGDGCQIGAMSLVLRSVPSGASVYGQTATVRIADAKE